MRTLIIIFLILVVGTVKAVGQEFDVMFYNVENLFDTVDDTTKNDDEFLPEGSRRWTINRYHKKLNAIARVVAAGGRWELPLLAGFCEVENEKVMRDLVYGTILSAGNYGIVHRESPDPRGIDLALIYRRDFVRIHAVRSWIPEYKEATQFESRNLLYVKMTVYGDTLHLIMCHFPSRRGGVLAAGQIRQDMALLVREKADSIIKTDANAALIVMGDFNAGNDNETIRIIISGVQLVNPASGMASRGEGSYKYHGMWEMIDQIIVTASMTEGCGQFRADLQSFRTVSESFMLADDAEYPGKKPFSTYSGFRWAGGYSDHLPVMITINHVR
jgi:hypothetical protein